MNTYHQCLQMQGSWVHFKTPWGYHRGIIERVNNQGVLMRVPRHYAPTAQVNADASDEAKVAQALQLVGWSNAGYGAPGYGYGTPGYGTPGYGNGRPGYGWWGAGWWWWWLAFAWIFWLAFLW